MESAGKSSYDGYRNRKQADCTEKERMIFMAKKGTKLGTASVLLAGAGAACFEV